MHTLLYLLHGHFGLLTIVASALALLLLALVVAHKRKPTPEERERRRRARLASTGRVVDGALTDAHPSFQQPETIFYRYRIAGVFYECAQDIRPLATTLDGLGTELPLQVRYNRNNPGDSIVLAENWNGLWAAQASRVLGPVKSAAASPRMLS